MQNEMHGKSAVRFRFETLVDVHGRVHVRGLLLRYALTNQIWRMGRAVSVAELVDMMARKKFVPSSHWIEQGAGDTPPRASKLISDALRTEVKRGRLVRLRRGRYAPGFMPRQTESRIRNRVLELERLVAGVPPPPS